MDFGVLPETIEERLTDTQFEVWLELKKQEAEVRKKLESKLG
jgi:hypothetical protein